MKKLLQIQNKLTPKTDKLAHFFWGFWYSFFGTLLYFLTDWIYWIVVPTIILAASKEIRDYFGYGRPETRDFIFTIIPSILILILIIINK